MAEKSKMTVKNDQKSEKKKSKFQKNEILKESQKFEPFQGNFGAVLGQFQISNNFIIIIIKNHNHNNQNTELLRAIPVKFGSENFKTFKINLGAIPVQIQSNCLNFSGQF